MKVKRYTEAVKLYTNSFYLLDLYLQNEGEGENVSCIHIRVVWPVFETIREGIFELVEFGGSGLYSALKGFNLCMKN